MWSSGCNSWDLTEEREMFDETCDYDLDGLNPALPLKFLQLLCLSAPPFPIYKELMRLCLCCIAPRLHSLILTKGFEILRWPVQEK